MSQGYVELRKSSARGTDSIAADIMRHLHARQHLGKAVIIHDQPLDMLGPARKQWLKLTRAIQKHRSATLNADKILKHTHTITRMQRMRFSAKSPLEQPDADVYFLTPADTTVMPVQCWTVYLLCPIDMARGRTIQEQLPLEALVVDYNKTAVWEQMLGMQPKSVLESQAVAEWRHVEQFFASHHIAIANLTGTDPQAIEAMDDALDTLLGHSRKFLSVANEFQRTLELARPLRVTKEQREAYDVLALLAHRVQALSPGFFTQHFLAAYNEDDTFFLNDQRLRPFESLAELFAYHMAAGRRNLAFALQTEAANRLQKRPSPSLQLHSVQ